MFVLVVIWIQLVVEELFVMEVQELLSWIIGL